MEAQSIKEYERLEKYYWWFIGRRYVIAGVLKKYFSGGNLRILDWGCGPGGNFKFLQKYGQILGVDSSNESLSACKSKGINNVVKATTLDEFKSDTKFDLITNFDVLEHIQEDESFLAGLHRLLVPQGYILVTVPAFQFLWSGLDDIVGHKRRYTKKELCDKFSRNGYDIVMASYFIFFLSPAFILFRMLQKIKKSNAKSLNESVVEFPRVINGLFAGTLYIESLIAPYISLPFGTSIIVLAKQK